MGISPFNTRWDLLQEKAGLKENTFSGNRYTEYGRKIEPLIREYINRNRKKKFEPNQVINGDIRCHTDGFNGACVLEIKSTSSIHETVDEYKIYLVQLLKYMEENKVKNGILAVYHRPEDFSIVFDHNRLQVFEIKMNNYTDMLGEVNAAIDSFRADLERLKANPLLSEQDFQPNELVVLSQQVVLFESRLAEMKKIEADLKKAKQALFDAMTQHDVKSWETPNGTKITRVDSTPGKTEIVAEFDTEAFKEENPAMFEMYLHEVEKKTNGKSRILLG